MLREAKIVMLYLIKGRQVNVSRSKILNGIMSSEVIVNMK